MRTSGDHMLVLCEDAPELIASAARFVGDGLTAGKRCQYVGDDAEFPRIAGALANAGIDADSERRRGALVFMNAVEFAGPAPFDRECAAELLRRRTIDAETRRFSGLQIVTHATGAFAPRPGHPAPPEYEPLMERAVGLGPITAICIYRRDRLDQGALQQLAPVHTNVIANDFVYLSLSAYFQNLPKHEVRELVRSSRERTVARGEFFFRQEEPATDVYMLTSGAVKIVRADAEGHGVVLRLVNLLEPFAERGYLGGRTRLASAQALDDSRALAWDAPSFDQTIVKNPTVALNNIRMLADMVETERRRLEDFAAEGVDRRLARLLLRLAQSIGRNAGRGLTVDVSLSRQDLAELVISTPYTVSRILADWRRLDIVDAQRERILILDPEAMAALADSASPNRPAPVRNGRRRKGPTPTGE